MKLSPTMRILTRAFILLLSVSTVRSTSISLYSVESRNPLIRPTSLICDPAPSAFCCHPPPGWSTALAVEFNGLPLNNIAAVYAPQPPPPGFYNYQTPSFAGCDGRIIDLHTGSPHWEHWTAVGQSRIAGADWLECPSAKPTKVGGISGWNLRSWCLPNKMVNVLDRRGTEEEWQGRRRTMKWGYPNIISFNGTNYTDGWRGDLIYRDGQGRVLDLNTVK